MVTASSGPLATVCSLAATSAEISRKLSVVIQGVRRGTAQFRAGLFIF